MFESLEAYLITYLQFLVVSMFVFAFVGLQQKWEAEG